MKPTKTMFAAVLIVFGLFCAQSCADDDDDSPTDVEADTTDATADVIDDASDDQMAEVVDDTEEDGGQAIDPELVGIYAFFSATLEEGTFTPNFQDAPIPGSPDRQVALQGALTLRLDGTYTRVLKTVMRENQDAEAEFFEDTEEQMSNGTWSVDGDTITREDEDEGTANWTYDYNDESGRITLDAIEGEEIEQMMWDRVSIDADLVGEYDLITLRMADGIVLTSENTTIGASQMRVEAHLSALEDGIFNRQMVIFVNDVEGDDIGSEGIWFVDADILVVEQPDELTLLWDYTYTPENGQMTMNNRDTEFPMQDIVWERAE